MIPNNNFSILPWYTSIDQQNARKWWVYGRVFPLFTPAGFLPPFQLMRESETTKQYSPGPQLVPDETFSAAALGVSNGSVYIDSTEYTAEVEKYDLSAIDSVFFSHVPLDWNYSNYYNIVFTDAGGNVIKALQSDLGDNEFTGGMDVPAGAKYVYIQQFWEPFPDYQGAVYEANVTVVTTPVTDFRIYTKEDQLVGEYPAVCNAIQIKSIRNYDYLIYTGTLPFVSSFNDGQYYARIVSGSNIWYSEVFTVVNDITPYIKIEWWDNEDFVMDAGTIVYKNPAFKNVLYLNADIAKPEYPFEEEGEMRDGYFFPVKMISEKRYRFKFFASEYLLDVMRFIRMADFANIIANGQVYSLDTFLITPEWEDNGDVASVEAQFDTATVAKKIGVGYIKAQRGDFNDDFNNDYNNE